MRVGSLVTCPLEMVGSEHTPLLRGLHGRVVAINGRNVSVRWEFPHGGSVTYVHFDFELSVIAF